MERLLKTHDVDPTKEDYLGRIKLISEENRVLAEQLRESEVKFRQEHDVNTSLKERVFILEEKNKELQEKLDEKSGEFIAKEVIQELRTKLDKITNENITYKKINEGQAIKFLKENSRHLKETTQLRAELSEKEKEISLLNMKIKELERNNKVSPPIKRIIPEK